MSCDGISCFFGMLTIRRLSKDSSIANHGNQEQNFLEPDYHRSELTHKECIVTGRSKIVCNMQRDLTFYEYPTAT